MSSKSTKSKNITSSIKKLKTSLINNKPIISIVSPKNNKDEMYLNVNASTILPYEQIYNELLKQNKIKIPSANTSNTSYQSNLYNESTVSNTIKIKKVYYISILLIIILEKKESQSSYISTINSNT